VQAEEPMTKNMQEFKEFINKGNVVALAIGVIIATEFGKVVNSLVENVIMPPVGKILGGVDFSNMYLSLSSAVPQGLAFADAQKLGPILGYGKFVTTVISFLIVAYVVFWIAKVANKFSKTPIEPEVK
jgi:large conductance mechanosensitive channel